MQEMLDQIRREQVLCFKAGAFKPGEEFRGQVFSVAFRKKSNVEKTCPSGHDSTGSIKKAQLSFGMPEKQQKKGKGERKASTGERFFSQLNQRFKEGLKAHSSN